MPQDNRNKPSKPNAKTRTITIFGGHAAQPDSDAYRIAHDIGRGLAEAGFEVLSGGYGGTMEAANKGARTGRGTTVGITCPSIIRNAEGPLQPNAYLDEIHPAPDLLTRIDTMMRSGGGYVVLDGGTGTLCELGIVWEFISKGFAPSRPIALVGNCWNGLVDQMAAHRSASTKHIHRTTTPEQVVEIMTELATAGTRARFLRRSSEELNDSTTTISELGDLVERFVEQRNWQPFHDPKNLSASIAIEAGELMEHFQWLRSDQLDEVRRDDEQMTAVREEIADVLAYVLSFASTMKIDLASALADKMKKNEVKYPAAEYRGRFK